MLATNAASSENATKVAADAVKGSVNKPSQNVVKDAKNMSNTANEAPLPMRLGNKKRYELIAPTSKTSLYLSKAWTATKHGLILTGEFLTHPDIAKAKSAKAWKSTKNGLKHVWISTKLFGKELVTGSKLIIKLLKGNILTRREKKQLTRATSDLLRMIPFSVFIIVPFMEFTLPFFLKFFPNMLPSTFESQVSKEEKLQKSLETQLELASVFQDSIEQLAQKKIDDNQDRDTAEKLLKVIADCRHGELNDTNELVKLSKIFTDNLTIDNMPRTQLVTLCKFMNLTTFGPDEYLRIQLRNKIRHIMHDDLDLYRDGIEDMSIAELRPACQERGLINSGLKKNGYYTQLSEWLDLSVNKKVPITLLLLSNALAITSRQHHLIDNLQNSLSALSDDVVKEAIIEASPSNDKIAKAIKLDRVQDENKKIHAEQLITDLKTDEQLDSLSTEFSTSEEAAAAKEEPQDQSSIAIQATTASGADVNLTVKEVETIKAMASNSFVVNERETLEEIKSEMKDIAEDVKIEEPEHPAAVDKAIFMLNKMLKNIEKDLNDLDTKIGTSKKYLDHDDDGYIHKQELVYALIDDLKATNSEEEARSIIDKMDHDKDGKVSIQNLEYILNKSYTKDEPLPTMEEIQEEEENHK